MQVFRVSKPPYRSTGVALVPLGEDWLVKLRYSSTTLAPEELGARMQAVLGALAWPKTIAPVPAARPIADCTTTLRTKDDAKPRGDALGSSLLQGALLGAIAKGEVKPEKTAHVATFCRDPAAHPELGNAGVYRADGERDGYLIALGDAGRGIYVTIVMWPLAVDRTFFDIRVYMKPVRNMAERVCREAIVAMTRDVMREDFDHVEPQQSALSLDAVGHLQLSDQELAVRHGYAVLQRIVERGFEGEVAA